MINCTHIIIYQKQINLNLLKFMNSIDTFLMVKSNLYGFGYKSLTFYNREINIAVNTLNDFQRIKKFINKIGKIILLYPKVKELKKISKIKNMYPVIIKKEDIDLYMKNKYYIRTNISFSSIGVDIRDIDIHENLVGIIYHINEYLSDSEYYKINTLIDELKNIKHNIGGSKVLEYNFYNKIIEKRLALRIFTDNLGKPLLKIKIKILECKEINESLCIGYRSCERKIKKGFLYSIEFGYSDSILPVKLYENRIPLYIENTKLYFAVYPSMNISWLYSNKKIDAEYIEIGNEKNSFLYFANKLNIDVDEILSTLSPHIYRKYKI